MSDFIRFSVHSMEMEAVQSLLEGKRIARSLENTVEALIPVVSNEEVIKQLEGIRESAAIASHVFQRLYNKNAKEAFGRTDEPERDSRQVDRDSSARSRRGDVSERPEAGSSEVRGDRPDGK